MPSTCWRRLRDWEEQEVWLTIWRAFLAELNERQQLKWSESFLEGSFAPTKKGLRSRKNHAGQGDEVDAGGRRRGCSSGKPPSRCVPVGGHARRVAARGGPCRASASRRSSSAKAAAVYFHPWEIDPGQPRIPGSLKSRLRHYSNLGKMEKRIENLLAESRFVSFKSFLENHKADDLPTVEFRPATVKA